MTETVTVLYPFIEEAYTEATDVAVEEIKKLSSAGNVSPVIIVNKHGRITDLLKKNRLSYYELKIAHLIGPQDFYLKAMCRLFLSSLPLFLFIKSQSKIDVVHFHDMMSALSWGGASRMYRLPYVISFPEAGKYAKYASLVITDARRLSCPSEMIKERLPLKYSVKTDVVPTITPSPVLQEKQADKKRRQWLKENKIPEKALLLAAEINVNLDELLFIAEKAAEENNVPVYVILAGNTERISAGKVTFLSEETGLFADILPFCHAFLGLDAVRINSPDSYKAMQANIPVFAIDEGVYPEFIQNGKTGFLLTSSQTEKRAALFNGLSADKEQCRKISLNAKQWVDTMTRDSISFWSDLYTSLSSGKKLTASVGLLNKK